MAAVFREVGRRQPGKNTGWVGERPHPGPSPDFLSGEGLLVFTEEVSFYPEVLEKGLRSERALALILVEMHIQGYPRARSRHSGADVRM